MCVVEIGLLEINIKMQTGHISEVSNQSCHVHCVCIYPSVIVIHNFSYIHSYVCITVE